MYIITLEFEIPFKALLFLLREHKLMYYYKLLCFFDGILCDCFLCIYIFCVFSTGLQRLFWDYHFAKP